MPFFTDFAEALESYISDSVELSIVNVDPPGTTINVSEVCTFQARVANQGELKMTDVSLEIVGLNGTEVSASETGPWTASIVVDGLTVPKGAERDTSTLYFRAPGVTLPAFSTLVNVHVKGWNASLDSLLINKTREEPDKFGHYFGQVYPS